jgi:hypothetical protein
VPQPFLKEKDARIEKLKFFLHMSFLLGCADEPTGGSFVLILRQSAWNFIGIII